MTPLFKVVAASSAVGGALVAALEVAIASAQQTTVPAGEVIGGGVTGGVIVGAVAWATYKQKVDQHAEAIRHLEETKADKDALDQHGEMLREMREDVRWLVRNKRGE